MSELELMRDALINVILCYHMLKTGDDSTLSNVNEILQNEKKSIEKQMSDFIAIATQSDQTDRPLLNYIGHQITSINHFIVQEVPSTSVSQKKLNDQLIQLFFVLTTLYKTQKDTFVILTTEDLRFEFAGFLDLDGSISDIGDFIEKRLKTWLNGTAQLRSTHLCQAIQAEADRLELNFLRKEVLQLTASLENQSIQMNRLLNENQRLKQTSASTPPPENSHTPNQSRLFKGTLSSPPVYINPVAAEIYKATQQALEMHGNRDLPKNKEIPDSCSPM